jgi:serine/threonine protein kinase
MIGKQILQYRILSLIGEGGMGAVWLAEHTHLSRKVAIKSLHAHLVRNEQLRLRFKNEAALLVQLQHPGIVNLIDYYEDSEGLYLILEYVDGTPLDDYIRNVSGPIPFEKASAWMLQILSAFSFAHGKNIVHRDIKPSNILITNEGQIKILDFGIAKLLNDSNAKLTRTGTQMGTVYYMSPEQVRRTGGCTQRYLFAWRYVLPNAYGTMSVRWNDLRV